LQFLDAAAGVAGKVQEGQTQPEKQYDGLIDLNRLIYQG
jgi:hypothetical protein